MKVVLDSHYAPCLNWWKLFLEAEEVFLEQHSFIRKGSYRNRCHIYGANGLLRLSIPIKKGKSQRSTIDNVEISYDHDWHKLHWESLCSAYRSSPYFEYYEDELAPFYEKQYEHLFQFNLELISALKDLLGIEKNIQLTEEYQLSFDGVEDFREIIHPNLQKDSVHQTIESNSYPQVFDQKYGYIENLSILDLLFNEGPSAIAYLQSMEWKR